MYYRYEYKPNDPEGNDKRARKASLLGCFGTLLAISIFGGILFYIIRYAQFLGKTKSFTEFLVSAGIIVFIGIVFFVIFMIGLEDDRKNLLKYYFIYFFGGLLDFTGIITIIHAIGILKKERYASTMLWVSILSVLFITLILILVYVFSIKKKRIKLFTNKKAIKNDTIDTNKNTTDYTSTNVNPDYIYCHKCGKKLPNDSKFCNSCGATLQP